MTAPSLLNRVEQFLFHEANLIDDRNFDAWLNLFTEDALYWVPSNDANIDPSLHVSIVHDTKEELNDRIWRLGSGAAYAQEPASKTIHQLANIQVDAAEQNNEIIVRCHLVIYEYRHNHHLLSMDTVMQYPARCEYRLKPSAESFQIVLRKINLIAANGVLGNMGFII
ncbi:MAG: aromatic-ring-hydroxylating dioxygenase subunit beta [Immundisolibacteraceae bacterium]|nr:aromatic-ring-hydroxylating dioxygenase subunit beta [Immundisolibacteraceae bacterium]